MFSKHESVQELRNGTGAVARNAHNENNKIDWPIMPDMCPGKYKHIYTRPM